MEGNPNIQSQVFRGYTLHVLDHLCEARKIIGLEF